MKTRGMGSFISMPIVGMVIGRVDARKILAAGLAVGSLTLFWLGSLNMSLGYWDIFSRAWFLLSPRVAAARDVANGPVSEALPPASSSACDAPVSAGDVRLFAPAGGA